MTNYEIKKTAFVTSGGHYGTEDVLTYDESKCNDEQQALLSQIYLVGEYDRIDFTIAVLDWYVDEIEYFVDAYGLES